jgi:hypothetical protein
MSKYYVQSGTLRAVIHSADPQRAAMWAVQRAMDAVLPNEDEWGSVDGTERGGEALQLATHTTTTQRESSFVALGPAILLSEIGFDRSDAMQFDTFQVFGQWHALVQAIDQIACLL